MPTVFGQMSPVFAPLVRESLWFSANYRFLPALKGTKADHGRQTRAERTDHVVWPGVQVHSKRFQRSTHAPHLLHPSPPRFHLAVMVSRVKTLNRIAAMC